MNYDIHDNHSVPYTVRVTDKLEVLVKDEVKLTFNHDQIWMPDDGHVILIRVGDEYVFIGSSIFKFTTNSVITEFHSEIGNNDVPYPYAVDASGKLYMLIEDAIVTPRKPWVTQFTDMYRYYYSVATITEMPGFHQPVFKNFRGISDWYLGGDPYCMRYTINFDYDDLVQRLGAMTIRKHGNLSPLSKIDYDNIMLEFGMLAGIEKLEKQVIEI